MAPADDSTLPDAQRRLRMLKLRLDRLDVKSEKLDMSAADAAIRLGRLEARLDIVERGRRRR